MSVFRGLDRRTARWLEEVTRKGVAQVDVRPLSVGRSYRVRGGRLRCVVKVHNEAAALDTEVRAAALAHRRAPGCVPELISRHGLLAVWEDVPGVPLGRWVEEQPEPGATELAIEALGRTLQSIHCAGMRADRTIHDLDVRAGIAHEIANARRAVWMLGRRAPAAVGGLLAAVHAGGFRGEVERLCSATVRLLRRSDGVGVLRRRRLVHGDLWGENVLISSNAAVPRVTLVDFEWARRSDPLVDTARLYLRGFAARNLRRRLIVGASPGLWAAFERGYRNAADTDTSRVAFRLAGAYGMLRTTNYYFDRLRRHGGPREARRTLRSIRRIAGATSDFLEAL